MTNELEKVREELRNQLGIECDWNDEAKDSFLRLVDGYAVEFARACVPEEQHLMGVLGDEDFIRGVGFNDCRKEVEANITRLSNKV